MTDGQEISKDEQIEEINAELFYKSDEELREIANAGDVARRNFEKRKILEGFNDGAEAVMTEDEELATLAGDLARLLHQNRRLERDAYGENPDEEPGLHAAM